MARAFDNKDSDVLIDSRTIINLERVYFCNHCVRYCRAQILDGLCTRFWYFDGIDPADLKLHPEFREYTTRKLGRFLDKAVDQILVQGFVVYRVEAARKGVLYPFPCVVPVDDETRYVIRRRDNPENMVSTIRRDKRDSWFLNATSHNDSEKNRMVTYYFGEDEPDPRTGDIRSVMRSVYYQISLTQNIEHSAMYSERTRSMPSVLTKRKTDQAFDERFLSNDIDTTSDERAMLVMENMHLRDRMDTALQSSKNDETRQRQAVESEPRMTLDMYQVPDPLDGWNNFPRFVPLPMDADVAPSPVPGARGDLTALQSNCDTAIRRAFGFNDTPSKGNVRPDVRDTQRDGGADDLNARRLYMLRATVQSLLRDVWKVCYAQTFSSTGLVVPRIGNEDLQTLRTVEPWNDDANEVASKNARS
ncbi:hypothetical protein CYMTET_3674 [Cymbomonas tetramitiformis]|uniref:Uncharacterized protein n=1 Tax=Cymbomonas tetramitiformis TaxID=36881 RepID=A0AAE0H2M6_9CHLO|nr:hypothetical protein CYMTET_3674 [Cymbomonas tetramitiformis]|eukprot:gene1506-2139_t